MTDSIRTIHAYSMICPEVAVRRTLQDPPCGSDGSRSVLEGRCCLLLDEAVDYGPARSGRRRH